MRAPIPQRIAPLSWRKPAFIWTPLALALAAGWPAALFAQQPGLQRLALLGAIAVFAVALASLGAAFALGRVPKARRDIVRHVLMAATAVALLAPLARAAASPAFTLDMAFAAIPLTLILALPVAFISALIFAYLALDHDAD